MDSQYSQIHMQRPRTVLYAPTWLQDKLPVDDIDVGLQQLPPLPDDEVAIQQSSSHLILTRNKQQKTQPVWTDMGLETLIQQYLDSEEIDKIEVYQHQYSYFKSKKNNETERLPMQFQLEANRRHQSETSNVRAFR
ncbi:anaphase-promoting complex subunit Apc13 [Schizosaccharomyces japonicus yFS275]|uniref:Anaphase-promoting complex subunit Apc13 n=1 Tax=Schizosaccharomyces japonicus (strain yFS275 / FY16936) TaxID=402676 RepID=B6K717_SCHJY|nr:anaphase-promoting complex subunit Apc13 [Schizosaccharomyces japonicus yFS275]EEB09321.1 anaphase-promoting complex subunit Apc13 [Schizosaccharomyces japonicus yFS275]